VNGAGVARLTNNPWTDNNPRWSPDGSKIVFQRFLNTNGRVWIMNADGSGQVAVSPLAPTGRDSKPSWSPDGRRIVFATERYGNGTSLALVNVDGTGLARLTEHVGDDSQPTWSPDGRFIAFATDRWATPTQEYKYDIAVIRADGSDLRQITRNTDQEALPHWSPDGGKLVYTCWRRRNNVVFSELCSSNADGTGEVRLTPRIPWASHPAWYR
jgi:TolB protein